MNFHSNSRENEIRAFAGNGQNSREGDFSSEINRLSGELNQTISHEMNDLISSVISQIQNDISEAIIEQVLRQIQSTLRSGQEPVPRKGWNVPAERQEYRPKKAFNCKFRTTRRMLMTSIYQTLSARILQVSYISDKSVKF